MKITILYSGHQFDYLYGLVSGLAPQKDIHLTIIDAVRKDEEISFKGVTVLKYFNNTKKSLLGKISRWIKYYYLVLKYLAFSDYDIIHIEWFSRRFIKLEEIVFPLIIKLRGKKIFFKVHDISSNLLLQNNNTNYEFKLSRTKRFYYKNVDCFFVHNDFVKKTLIENNIDQNRIEVLPHGINNYVPVKNKSKRDCRNKLGISSKSKIILFFGNISPYKNLESVLNVLPQLNNDIGDVKILIAGNFRSEHNEYRKKINKILEDNQINTNVLSYFNFIPNNEIEDFFVAADVLILPYKFIFQSGVVFLSYRFGTPVIVKNIGGLSEDVVSGRTGFIYEDDSNLVETVKNYFSDNLYKNEESRNSIKEYTYLKYSWNEIAIKMIMHYKNSLK